MHLSPLYLISMRQKLSLRLWKTNACNSKAHALSGSVSLRRAPSVRIYLPREAKKITVGVPGRCTPLHFRRPCKEAYLRIAYIYILKFLTMRPDIIGKNIFFFPFCVFRSNCSRLTSSVQYGIFHFYLSISSRAGSYLTGQVGSGRASVVSVWGVSLIQTQSGVQTPPTSYIYAIFLPKFMETAEVYIHTP